MLRETLIKLKEKDCMYAQVCISKEPRERPCVCFSHEFENLVITPQYIESPIIFFFHIQHRQTNNNNNNHMKETTQKIVQCEQGRATTIFHNPDLSVNEKFIYIISERRNIENKTSQSVSPCISRLYNVCKRLTQPNKLFNTYSLHVDTISFSSSSIQLS